MTGSEVQSVLLPVLRAGGDMRLGARTSLPVGSRAPRHATKRPADPMPSDRSPIGRTRPGVHRLLAAGCGELESAPYRRGSGCRGRYGLNPDDPSGYLRRLMADVAAIRTTAELTRRRPSTGTHARLYRPSAVMLGVASEAAVLEVATALTTLMIEAERRKNVCSLCPEALSSQNDPGKESCLTTPSIELACIHPQRPLTAAG